jgi:hypothetical protein
MVDSDSVLTLFCVVVTTLKASQEWWSMNQTRNLTANGSYYTVNDQLLKGVVGILERYNRISSSLGAKFSSSFTGKGSLSRRTAVGTNKVCYRYFGSQFEEP